MTLITYKDGPFKGDTVEVGPHVNVIQALACSGDRYETVRYHVDRPHLTATLLHPPDLKLVRDASTAELLAVLTARAVAGDQFAVRHLTEFTSLTRRSRRALARFRRSRAAPTNGHE